MLDVLNAFLKAYLPKEISLPDSYTPESGVIGTMGGPVMFGIARYEFINYTFNTQENAEAFVKAIQPFVLDEHFLKIEKNSVRFSSQLFLEVLKKACGPVLIKSKEFLSPIRYPLQEDPYGNLHIANIQSEKSKDLSAELKEIGITVSKHNGLLYMRRGAHLRDFDFEKLTAQVHKHIESTDYQKLTSELQKQREEAIAIVKKLVEKTGHAREFYYTDDERGFRVLSRNKQLVEDFSANILIGQFGYNWDPKEGGRAWERGGHGSGYGEYLVVVELEKFAKLYNEHTASFAHKDVINKGTSILEHKESSIESKFDSKTSHKFIVSPKEAGALTQYVTKNSQANRTNEKPAALDKDSSCRIM